MIIFDIQISDKSSHMVQVVLHNTRAGMRRALTRHGHKDPRNTEACCLQVNKLCTDNIISEIHLNREFLTMEYIAHECCHAAYHRTVLQGIPLDDEEFQEFVAETTGSLTDALVAEFTKKRIRITYEKV